MSAWQGFNGGGGLLRGLTTPSDQADPDRARARTHTHTGTQAHARARPAKGGGEAAEISAVLLALLKSLLCKLE